MKYSRRLLVLAASVLVLIPMLTWAATRAQLEYLDVLKRTPDPVEGEKLYETCAACHATDGGGTADGSVPLIAGQHFRVIARQLVDFRHDRRWDIRMEHFVDRHRLQSTQELADLAAYITGLQRRRASGNGPGETLALGASTYFRDCESCHGPVGEGDAEEGIPMLAGQHFEYLQRQIYDAVDGRRPNMEGPHVELLKQFEREQIVGVADYLSRLAPPAPASQGSPPTP